VSSDAAVRVSLRAEWGEIAGAILGDELGPFQFLEDEPETAGGGQVHLVFYPFRYGAGFVPDEAILALLPADPGLRESVVIERVLVPGGWEENWRQFFPPLTLGRLYVRPPWEAPAGEMAGKGASVADGGQSGRDGLLDVVINPGLAFGTGLHATTKGILELLQEGSARGPLVDAGTGSGILAIAASRLGFAPVLAFDDDPLAVDAARSNAAANGVTLSVERAGVEDAPIEWFAGAVVLANITMGPVLALVDRLRADAVQVRRLLVAGILSGDQEGQVLEVAGRAGLRPARRLPADEWVALELVPADSEDGRGALSGPA
jgi:ribosomal protein L11 methyltransferase